VNWCLLVAAFGQLLLRLSLGRAELVGLAVGFGAVTAVLWEFAEYLTFVRGGAEEATAYTDTLGDLALGLSGSVVAALVTAVFAGARRESQPRPARSPRAAPRTPAP
jgi:hypothetical protein